MLDVVCWLWKPAPEYRSQFSVEHVNTLQRMIARHYPHPHRFSCVTDQRDGFGESVRVIPLWSDYADRESIYGPNTPSCYRRLRAFSGEMRDMIGKRFVSIDLDVVITGDLSPVFNRPEDFVIWGGKRRRTPWNGSMWMMNAGAREQVWTRFNNDPAKAVSNALSMGFYGSDQAWMNYALGPNEAHWNEDNGVYSYRMNIKGNNGELPENAKIVFFEGRYDPWSDEIRRLCPWVTTFYR